MLRLPPFEFLQPGSVEEAVEALASPGTQLLAGGTDVLPNLKHRLVSPSALVGLNRVRELRGVRVDEAAKQLVIGCRTSLAEVARDESIRQHFPSLAQAAGGVASPPIRNQATLGGNLHLEPRCRYVNQTEFWRSSINGCLKSGGEVCHVVPTGKKCVAAMSSDCTPVLISLDAIAVLRSAGGERTVALADYYQSDGLNNTRRERGELLTELRLPWPGGPRRAAYARWAVRGAIDFPLVSAALRFDLDADHADALVTDARIVVGALAARPRLIRGLENLVGSRFSDPELPSRVAEQVHDQCHPLENLPYDAPYRRHMLRVQVRRTIARLASSQVQAADR